MTGRSATPTRQPLRVPTWRTSQRHHHRQNLLAGLCHGPPASCFPGGPCDCLGGTMSRKRKLPDGMVTRPGRKGYYADFKVGGRRIQKKLGTDFDAAKSILTDLRARAERADFNLLDNNHPIADLRRQYIAHCKQALEASTVRCYEDWLDTILPALGVVKVSQLTIPAVVAYRERRLAKGRSPRTVNGEVGALATM